MDLNFDSQCREAVDLAKRAIPDEGKMDVLTLMAALYHGTDLKRRLPDLTAYLKAPKSRRKESAEKVPVEELLRPLLADLAEHEDPIKPHELFARLIKSEYGREALISQGMPESTLKTVLDSLDQRKGEWRSSPERREALEALGPFGRVLTENEPPHSGMVEKEDSLKELIVALMTRKKRNAIVIGPPGTGKSALVYELASRIVGGHPSIPERLQDCDIFELMPSYLRAGASVVGQYDERVKALLEVLTAHPRIILFVDEIHSLFKSGMHATGPFSDANESFKGPLSSGQITCVGCTTEGEYRHFIEPDKALDRRFSKITLSPPSPETTVRILKARLPKVEAYYAPLGIPEGLVQRVVDLTEEHLPSRYQPDKSIQLLDKACAHCMVDNPQATELTEPYLEKALEDTMGHTLVRTERLTEEGVYEQLRTKIVGQDEVLKEIARAFVAGLGQWKKTSTPRGVFLFGGPTGVGKTETALVLSKILGDGEEQLIRIDCNTLQRSGSDSGPVTNRLLGVPPGYIGYVRGQGGILGRIRDMPESIVLFDEFEKADPGVGELLLQIIDEGRTEDVDGNLLDFRRAYIIFTTNAGCVYDFRTLGFRQENGTVPETPQVDPDALKHELRARGLGQEFLARISHVVMFKGLERNAIQRIIERQLEGLQETADIRGFELKWSPAIVTHLASRWQPRFGVRHLTTILRNRITEQLSVAEAQGELEGVKAIHLEVMGLEEAVDHPSLAGLVARKRDKETLVISLA